MRAVLASRCLRQSPRLGKLFRYLCGRVLADEADRVTEYTIAVDVLGKTEGFKEGKDAIVRVEVHRLRKRLVEYYEDEGASHRVHILIPPGNYAPRFLLREGGPESVVEPVREAAEPVALAPVVSRWRVVLLRRWLPITALLVLVSLLPAYEALRPGEQPLDTFWNPVLGSSGTVLLCIGTQAGGHGRLAPVDTSAGGPLSLRDFHDLPSQMVHLDDAATLARLAGLVASKGRPYRIVSQSEATYSDLRSSPVVLVGLLNNDWTKRFVGQLRFTVERPGPGKVLIRDRDNPAKRDWLIDYYLPYMDIVKDYALVLRATDPKTEQMTVTAAGLSVFGTIAAGEFLTNPAEMQKLTRFAPKGWKHKNVEVVLSTEVIRGKPGPPTVVATHFW